MSEEKIQKIGQNKEVGVIEKEKECKHGMVLLKNEMGKICTSCKCTQYMLLDPDKVFKTQCTRRLVIK